MKLTREFIEKLPKNRFTCTSGWIAKGEHNL